MKLSPCSLVRDMATFAYLMLVWRGTPKIPGGASVAFAKVVSLSEAYWIKRTLKVAISISGKLSRFLALWGKAWIIQ